MDTQPQKDFQSYVKGQISQAEYSKYIAAGHLIGAVLLIGYQALEDRVRK
jgi:hypothetical protein